MAQSNTGREWGSGADLPQAEAMARLRLIRSRRVGAVTYHRLMAEHGGAEAALAALPGIAAAAGALGYEVCPPGVVAAEMAAAARFGAQALFHGTGAYPAALTPLEDAPPLLWAIGDLRLLSRPMVALVGARNASALGLRMARKLALGLSDAGVVVVSGLARGIDAEAHQAALEGGTVAVLAGGVDRDYPEENAALAAQIRGQGLCLSEQPPGLSPQARHFPMRNRIVSGLSRGVVVVEAAARSGSLITAKLALEQGREVMAVPGHPFDARATGCNLLLRDGAVLVRGAADVLEALAMPAPRMHPVEDVAEAPRQAATSAPPVLPGPSVLPAGPSVLPGGVPPTRPLRETAALHSLILNRLGASPTAEDALMRDLALPPSLLSTELLSLELEGRLKRQPGGLLSRL